MYSYIHSVCMDAYMSSCTVIFILRTLLSAITSLDMYSSYIVGSLNNPIDQSLMHPYEVCESIIELGVWEFTRCYKDWYYVTVLLDIGIVECTHYKYNKITKWLRSRNDCLLFGIRCICICHTHGTKHMHKTYKCCLVVTPLAFESEQKWVGPLICLTFIFFI